MLRANFSDIFDSLLAALDEVYIQSRDLDESKANWTKVFSMKKSSRQFENVTGFSGFPKIGSVGEGADIPLYSVKQLYDKKFTHTKFAGGWQVTEEMEDDDQYELVASLGRAASRAYRFTKEVNFADTFNNGFGTETSADGSAIYATHTLIDSSTISNLSTADFGVSAAQTAFNHFATLTDDQGIRTPLKPYCLIGHPAMRWVFTEVMKSQLLPYSADNTTNVLNEEKLEMLLWPEITDQDAWFVSVKPSDLHGMGLRAYDRMPPTVSTDFKIENLTMLSIIRGRWSRGCVDWRQVYGSQGA